MFGRLLSLFIAFEVLVCPALALADQGAQCTMCTYVMRNSQARTSVLKNAGQSDDATLTKVLADTCDKMDGTPRDMCIEIVNADAKSFARSIRKNETPEEACQRAGMCLNMH
jgi:hypothetical protein